MNQGRCAESRRSQVFLRLFLLFATWTFAVLAEKREVVSVLLSSEHREPLDEAIVRLSAELRSAGFEVEVGILAAKESPSTVVTESKESPVVGEGIPKTEDSMESSSEPSTASIRPSGPRVELEEKEHGLEIRAFSDSGDAPLSQVIEWKSLESAEVIAIRAVELLRAGLLQSLRDGRLRGRPTSAVVKFTNFDDRSAPKKLRETPKPSSPPTASKTEAVSSTERSILHFVGALAPALHGEGSRSTVTVSSEVTGALVVDSFFVGATVDVGLIPLVWTLSEGEVEVRPVSLLWRTGWEVPCPRAFECQLGAVVGYHSLYMTSVVASGLGSETTRHSSLILGGDVFFGRFWTQGLGVIVHGRVGGMLDAPTNSQDDTIGPLGRPSWSVAVGIAARSSR